MDLYLKLHSEKLCMQFFVFHEVILDDCVFFTNFMQLIGGASVEMLDDIVVVDYDHLQHYSLLDMFSNDDYQLFSVLHTVYQ